MKFVTQPRTLMIAFCFFTSLCGKTDLPKLVVTKIVNNTNKDLVFIDKIKNRKIIVPAQQSSNTNFETSVKNIIINGSMRAVMAQEAQYVVKPTDTQNDQHEVYIHLNLLAGGIDDGSGIISGALGSTVLKFLLAGKQGGCQMQTSTLSKNDTKLVEVALVLTGVRRAIEENRFALDAEYTVIEK